MTFTVERFAVEKSLNRKNLLIMFFFNSNKTIPVNKFHVKLKNKNINTKSVT